MPFRSIKPSQAMTRQKKTARNSLLALSYCARIRSVTEAARQTTAINDMPTTSSLRVNLQNLQSWGIVMPSRVVVVLPHQEPQMHVTIREVRVVVRTYPNVLYFLGFSLHVDFGRERLHQPNPPSLPACQHIMLQVIKPRRRDEHGQGLLFRPHALEKVRAQSDEHLVQDRGKLVVDGALAHGVVRVDGSQVAEHPLRDYGIHPDQELLHDHGLRVDVRMRKRHQLLAVTCSEIHLAADFLMATCGVVRPLIHRFSVGRLIESELAISESDISNKICASCIKA